MIKSTNVNEIQEEGNSSAGELLEPFHPRKKEQHDASLSSSDEATLIRRGSLIVISTLEDSEEGLLETFGPRKNHSDADCDKILNEEEGDGAQGDDQKNEDRPTIKKSASMDFSDLRNEEELLEPFQERNKDTTDAMTNSMWRSFPKLSWSAQSVPSATSGSVAMSPKASYQSSARSTLMPLLRNSSQMTNSASTIDSLPNASVERSIWRALPSLWSSNSNNDGENDGQATTEKTQRERDHEKLVATINDDERFRELQQELRNKHVLTGGGTKHAVQQVMRRRRSRSSTPPPKPTLSSLSMNSSSTLSSVSSASSSSSSSLRLFGRRRSKSCGASRPLHIDGMKELMADTNLSAFREED